MKAHLPEYLSELFGTAIMMLIGISAVTIMFADGGFMQHSVPSQDLRRLMCGLLFAGGGTLVVLSPLGQRSGGHLNPAMTLAFWWKGKVTTPDALWYMVAQLAGALLGVFLVSVLFGEMARSVHLGLTAPGDGYNSVVAFLAEAVITFLLVFLILFCVGNQRFASRTPYLAGLLVWFLVFVEAPISGTSLNPARSLAPALMTGMFQSQWIYILAPVLGAVIGVKLHAYLFEADKHSGCAKLYHTERYRCIFLDCAYTRVEAGTVIMHQGDISDRAFVVERGVLEVRVHGAGGGEMKVATLGPGDWVGEMSLLLDQPRTATVTAVTDCELRTVTKQNFAHVVAEHPSETGRLLRQLAERLQQANVARAGSPLVQDPVLAETANT